MALYHSPDYQTSFESICLSVQEKFNIDFQDGGRLGFPIRIILVTFDLQGTLIIPMKFRGLLVRGKKKKKKKKNGSKQIWANILDFRSECSYF